MSRKQKKMLYRIIASIIVLVPLAILKPSGYASLLYLVPYLIIGYDILKNAIKGILRGQPFDENFLMATATVGAIILGEYLEAVAVMLFYQIGELFQSYAVAKSRRSISELMDIRPDYANIEDENGELSKVSPEEVGVGSIIIIKPGEKIPLDSLAIEGATTVNTSALTGESAPRDVSAGDRIMSGCINLTGVIRAKTEKEFSQSTVSKILDLVENASSKKSKSENFISKFARFYTPIVCFLALALALLVPLLSKLLGGEADFGTWIYRALTFLVISCPCALVISIPLSFFAGLGGAGRAGILIKGSNYLEALSKVKSVVFDKTGTMTKGVFEVVDIYESGMTREKILEYAALAESFSNHPIAESIIRGFETTPDRSRVESVREVTGQGIIATVDGMTVAAGNGRLMESIGTEYAECEKVGTVVHIAIDGDYAGYILIADCVKPDAKEAICDLSKMGIGDTVMLTGDIKAVGESVARELGIKSVYTDLLPEDKVRIVEELLEKSRGNLAFVGDGINDAPVLSRADVGIAMGALGSDAAIEAADVVLMDDSPVKIAGAVRIAKRCMRIVYQNIYFAIGVKAICLVLSAFGDINMWFAIFADVGVMVIAVLNAIRALSVRNV